LAQAELKREAPQLCLSTLSYLSCNMEVGMDSSSMVAGVSDLNRSRTASPDSLSAGHSEDFDTGMRTPPRDKLWGITPGSYVFGNGKQRSKQFPYTQCSDDCVEADCPTQLDEIFRGVPPSAWPFDSLPNIAANAANQQGVPLNLTSFLPALGPLTVDPEATDFELNQVLNLSVGTVGHPNTCGKACRYVWRKGGCRDGEKCTDCHACRWQRNPQEKQKPPAARKVKIQEEPSSCPSVGSIGHPHSCAFPCKYNSKANGCKDGKLCTRCHLCHWSRWSDKMSKAASAGAPMQIPRPANDETADADSCKKEIATQTD
jgi:hypothetical protein